MSSDHFVGAQATIENIIGVITGQNVVQLIAVEVERRTTQQQSFLDIGRQGVIDRRANHIIAFVRQFDQRIFQTVDDIGVVACATDQRVRSGTAIKHVVAGAALQGVGEAIADQIVVLAVTQHIKGTRAVDRDVFEVVQRAAVQIDKRVDLHAIVKNQGVATLIGVFFCQFKLTHLINDVGVVACATDHGIQPALAVEYVVAFVAGQDVVLAVTDCVDIAAARQFEIFQVRAQCPAHRGPYSVDLTCYGAGFEDDIIEVVDDIGIVTCSTDQGVSTAVTVENVIAGVTGDHVVRVVAVAIDVGVGLKREVLHVFIAIQAVAGRGKDRIDFARRCSCFVDPVIPVVDVVGIVTGTAIHPVHTRAAIEDVVQAVAAQDVVVVRANRIFDLGAIGNAQSALEYAPADDVGQSDFAVGALIEVDVDLVRLRARIDRIVAASIPDGFENGLVSFPGVDVITGLPIHIGAVKRLDGEDIQHHRSHRLI